jgi:hypothetical protein
MSTSKLWGIEIGTETFLSHAAILVDCFAAGIFSIILFDKIDMRTMCWAV